MPRCACCAVSADSPGCHPSGPRAAAVAATPADAAVEAQAWGCQGHSLGGKNSKLKKVLPSLMLALILSMIFILLLGPGRLQATTKETGARQSQ